jgi:hypothetical protein
MSLWKTFIRPNKGDAMKDMATPPGDPLYDD